MRRPNRPGRVMLLLLLLHLLLHLLLLVPGRVPVGRGEVGRTRVVGGREDSWLPRQQLLLLRVLLLLLWRWPEVWRMVHLLLLLWMSLLLLNSIPLTRREGTETKAIFSKKRFLKPHNFPLLPCACRLRNDASPGRRHGARRRPRSSGRPPHPPGAPRDRRSGVVLLPVVLLVLELLLLLVLLLVLPVAVVAVPTAASVPRSVGAAAAVWGEAAAVGQVGSRRVCEI